MGCRALSLILPYSSLFVSYLFTIWYNIVGKQIVIKKWFKNKGEKICTVRKENVKSANQNYSTDDLSLPGTSIKWRPSG